MQCLSPLRQLWPYFVHTCYFDHCDYLLHGLGNRQIFVFISTYGLKTRWRRGGTRTGSAVSPVPRRPASCLNGIPKAALSEELGFGGRGGGGDGGGGGGGGCGCRW